MALDTDISLADDGDWMYYPDGAGSAEMTKVFPRAETLQILRGFCKTLHSVKIGRKDVTDQLHFVEGADNLRLRLYNTRPVRSDDGYQLWSLAVSVGI